MRTSPIQELTWCSSIITSRCDRAVPGDAARDVWGRLEVRPKEGGNAQATEDPKKRRRDVGDGGISCDRTNKVYVGTSTGSPAEVAPTP
jgi:hypothetical protein